MLRNKCTTKFLVTFSFIPQRTNLEYGDVTKDINVIRLNGRFEPKVTHAYIKGSKYIITKRIDYEHDTVFYAEEVK